MSDDRTAVAEAAQVAQLTEDQAVAATTAGAEKYGVADVYALRDFGHIRQEYERARAITPVKDIGPSKRTGTRIKFKPDPEIFHHLTFDYDTLEARLRELAFLNKGLTVTLHDERAGKEQVFKYDGGLAEF